MVRKAPDVATFGAEIAAAYATKGEAIELGIAKLDDTLVPEAGSSGSSEIAFSAAAASPLQAKYGTRLDSQSARELLAELLDPPPTGEKQPTPTERQKGAATAAGKARKRSATSCSRRAAGR